MDEVKSGFINLEIENNLITCNKKTLIGNSDYFKAMFEGNFVESEKTTIKLEDVSLQSIEVILTLLRTKDYNSLNENNTLPVLQTACMLQFLVIKDKCVEQLSRILSVNNCSKIWCIGEKLNVKPIYLKAKYLAMLNFPEIGLTRKLWTLNLQEVCNYLGNMNLNYGKESDIYYAALSWYEEIGSHYTNNIEVALKLLSCVDFTSIEHCVIETIQANFETFQKNSVLTAIMSCIVHIKNKWVLEQFDSYTLKQANLLIQSNLRIIQELPCILFYNENSPDIAKIVYYDMKNSKLKTLLDFNFKNILNLDGFAMINYQNYLYLYGGEFLIGKGNWNTKFIGYNFVTDCYERSYISKPPYRRRHFQYCVINDILYIVAGVGTFRVIQENMFWFDFSKNKWGPLISLPCSGRQIKCCCFNGQLFILDINYRIGYFFNHLDSQWSTITIVDTDNILPVYSIKLSVFSYKNKLFIKENNLTELELNPTEKTLVIVKNTVLVEKQCDRSQSILCKNILFSLYKYRCEKNHRNFTSLDALNLDTLETVHIIGENSTNSIYDIDGEDEELKLRSELQFFNVFHYNALEGNEFVNTNFFK